MIHRTTTQTESSSMLFRLRTHVLVVRSLNVMNSGVSAIGRELKTSMKIPLKTRVSEAERLSISLHSTCTTDSDDES